MNRRAAHSPVGARARAPLVPAAETDRDDLLVEPDRARSGTSAVTTAEVPVQPRPGPDPDPTAAAHERGRQARLRVLFGWLTHTDAV
jgi:hypothetical protein